MPANVICNPEWRTATYSFYRYVPSVAAAVIFCLLFCASLLLHLFQMWRTKAWFLTALVVGCLFEFMGFAARTGSANSEPGCWKMMPYIIQAVYILIGPALFAASIYMTLGRIILLTDGEHYAMVKQRWLTKVFVTGDIVFIGMQSGGGGLMAAGRNNASLAKIGNNVIIASLILQLLWFALFCLVAVVFHRRMNKNPTSASTHPEV